MIKGKNLIDLFFREIKISIYTWTKLPTYGEVWKRLKLQWCLSIGGQQSFELVLIYNRNIEKRGYVRARMSIFFWRYSTYVAISNSSSSLLANSIRLCLSNQSIDQSFSLDVLFVPTRTKMTSSIMSFFSDIFYLNLTIRNTT